MCASWCFLPHRHLLRCAALVGRFACGQFRIRTPSGSLFDCLSPGIESAALRGTTTPRHSREGQSLRVLPQNETPLLLVRVTVARPGGVRGSCTGRSRDSYEPRGEALSPRTERFRALAWFCPHAAAARSTLGNVLLPRFWCQNRGARKPTTPGALCQACKTEFSGRSRQQQHDQQPEPRSINRRGFEPDICLGREEFRGHRRAIRDQNRPGSTGCANSA